MNDTRNPAAVTLANLRKPVDRVCETCGRPYQGIHRKTDAHHYCSGACRYKAYITANGGKRPAVKKPRVNGRTEAAE